VNHTYDLVVRNGTVVDGSGAAPFIGDVAVRAGMIVAVGTVRGSAAQEIDATGRLVTPGFVDIHTHYDGHATWADRLGPSSSHGVTTVLMGNCGVGFAPCKPEDRARLVQLMEGVEDIPEVVMAEGLPWNWTSFPDYLDRLAERRFDMDIATQIPHAPLRVYVMGDRASAREPATADDILQMRVLVKQAVEAGALGFSTSRSLNHKASDGTVTPSYTAASDELASIAAGLGETGRGVLQLISDFDDLDSEFDIARSGPMAFGVGSNRGGESRRFGHQGAGVRSTDRPHARTPAGSPSVHAHHRVARGLGSPISVATGRLAGSGPACGRPGPTG
jgi:N-acyl-D-amino-acid deacylase